MTVPALRASVTYMLSWVGERREVYVEGDKGGGDGVTLGPCRARHSNPFHLRRRLTRPRSASSHCCPSTA